MPETDILYVYIYIYIYRGNDRGVAGRFPPGSWVLMHLMMVFQETPNSSPLQLIGRYIITHCLQEGNSTSSSVQRLQKIESICFPQVILWRKLFLAQLIKYITPKLGSVSWFSSLLSLSSLKLKFYGYPLFFDKPTYRIDYVYVLYASCIPQTLIVG